MIPSLQTFTSICPANNRPIAQVTSGTNDEYDLCVEAAEEAWDIWADLTAPKRGEIVRFVVCQTRTIVNAV